MVACNFYCWKDK